MVRVKQGFFLFQINYQLATGQNPDLSLKKLLIAVTTLARNITENQVAQQVTEPRQVSCGKENLDSVPMVFLDNQV